MDSHKIQRVRELIAGGFYTDPEVLDSIGELLAEKHPELLLRDIEKCGKVSRDNCDEEAVRVHTLIVDDLMQYPVRDSGKCHDIVADVVARSLRKIADLALMQKRAGVHAK